MRRVSPGVVGDGEGAADVDSAGGVFDGVVEEVEDGGAEVFGDALDVEADGAGDGLEDDAVGREVVALEGDVDAVGDEGGEVDEGAVLLAMFLAELAGFEDLLDGGEEAVGVGEHDGVELLALGFVDGAALEGFEVEADAGDGGLELVGDGVEEGVLALVAADFADEEDGVEDDAGDEEREENDAEDGEGDGALVEEDPGIWVTARPTRRTPRVMKVAMAPRRRLMFMGSGGSIAGGQDTGRYRFVEQTGSRCGKPQVLRLRLSR